jgi:hypothetical protein
VFAQTACDDGTAHVYITGLTPLVMSQFTSGFNIARPLHIEPTFEGLHGFYGDDVMRGLSLITPALPEAVIESVYDQFALNHNGYRLRLKQKQPLFNSTRALWSLRRVQRAMADPDLQGATTDFLKDALAFAVAEEDPNSAPAEAALAAAMQSPQLSELCRKLLVSSDSSVECPGLLTKVISSAVGLYQSCVSHFFVLLRVFFFLCSSPPRIFSWTLQARWCLSSPTWGRSPSWSQPRSR